MADRMQYFPYASDVPAAGRAHPRRLSVWRSTGRGAPDFMGVIWRIDESQEWQADERIPVADRRPCALSTLKRRIRQAVCDG